MAKNKPPRPNDAISGTDLNRLMHSETAERGVDDGQDPADRVTAPTAFTTTAFTTTAFTTTALLISPYQRSIFASPANRIIIDLDHNPILPAPTINTMLTASRKKTYRSQPDPEFMVEMPPVG